MLRVLAAALACTALLQAADSEEHMRKSIPASSATRLVLSADVGGVRLQPGSDKSVDVDVYFGGGPPSRGELDRLRREFRLEVTQQGSEIHVTGGFRDGRDWMFSFWRWFSWPRDIEYRVTVPQKFNADLETAGGPIEVLDLHGQLHAHTSGGPIRISGVDGDVDVSTSGGPITIERNAGRVRAHTSGGPIEIREAEGAVDASTSGGPVTASLLRQPHEDCRLSTSGGHIDVRLSRDIRVDLDASTSGGRVWTDFPVTTSGYHDSNELRAALNGGGPRLYLHTSGGGISVRHAD
jgi:Putative adhesin